MVLNGDRGLVAHLFQDLGLNPIAFLSSAFWAMPSLVVATLWWGVGLPLALFLASLQQIPPELYEAAELDHASRLTVLRRITLPAIRRTTLLVVVLQLVAQFQMFGQSELMTRGGPADSTPSIVQYIYQTGFRDWQIGLAAAWSPSQSSARSSQSCSMAKPTIRQNRTTAMTRQRRSSVSPTAWAVGAYGAIRARGLSVPDDVSLVGFDDEIFASEMTPPMWIERTEHRRSRVPPNRDRACRPVACPRRLGPRDVAETECGVDAIDGRLRPDPVHAGQLREPARPFDGAPVVAEQRRGGDRMTLLTLVTSALAGYAFARIEFPGGNALFLLMLTGLMVPEQAVLIPLHTMFSDWGLHNTHLALMVPHVAVPVCGAEQAFLNGDVAILVNGTWGVDKYSTLVAAGTTKLHDYRVIPRSSAATWIFCSRTGRRTRRTRPPRCLGCAVDDRD